MFHLLERRSYSIVSYEAVSERFRIASKKTCVALLCGIVVTGAKDTGPSISMTRFLGVSQKYGFQIGRFYRGHIQIIIFQRFQRLDVLPHVLSPLKPITPHGHL